jgi:hypothetical protein
LHNTTRRRYPPKMPENINDQPAKIARTARARGRLAPGSCNGLFSLGIPYRGLTVQQRNTSNPTNEVPSLSFPLPSYRIAIGAGPSTFQRISRTGHQEAQLLTYHLIRVAQVVPGCKHSPSANHLYLQHLKEFPAGIPKPRRSAPVETLSFLWESTSSPSRITVQVGVLPLPFPLSPGTSHLEPDP